MKMFKLLGSCIVLLGQWTLLLGQSAIIQGTAPALKNDTLEFFYFNEREPFTQVVVDSNGSFQINIPVVYPREAFIRLRMPPFQYHVLLEAGKKIELIFEDSSLTFQAAAKNISERLHNDLHHSTNRFFATYGNDWQNWSPQVGTRVLDSLERTRAAQIEQAKDSLSVFEYRILQHRNSVLIQSAKLYFGRYIRQLPAPDAFYNFLDQIDLRDSLYKRSPRLALQKLEIAYLRKYKTITHALDFIKFIDNQTIVKDAAHFFEATYLLLCFQPPIFSEHFYPPLTLPVVDAVQAFFAANGNPYTYLYQDLAADFYKTQRGTPAPDFTGVAPGGEWFNLSEQAGRVVLVYVWATDCTACEAQKARVLQALEYFEQSARFTGVLLNIDTEPTRWLQTVTDDLLPSKSLHLYMANDLQQSFKQQYAIKQLPRFIIIDANTHFYHADVPPDDLNRLINDAILQK